MQNVTNALLNLILVSIPEEIFLVIMTLIFLKRFDMLDIRMWRINLKWIAIPVIPVAIMINLFRYIIIIPKPITSLIVLVLMNILMIYIILKNSNEKQKSLVLKTILFTFMSFIVLSIAEGIYVPITLFLLNKSILYFNNNIMYNFLLALPSRIFEYSLCAYILIKKNNSVNINLINIIIKNKFLKSSFLSLIIFVNMFLLYFTKLIGFDNILSNLSFIEQLLIVIGSISFPIVTIVWFLLIVNYISVKEKQIQQTYENLIMQDDFTADVEDLK